MKVILGPTPCATCHAPVTIVRRDVEQPCWLEPVFDDADDMCPNCQTPWKCNGPHLEDQTPWVTRDKAPTHTHTIRDVGPFTAVDADGTRHECAT